MWGCVFKINDASEKFYVTDIVSYWCVGSSLVCHWRSYSDFRWNGIYEGEYVYNVYVHEKKVCTVCPKICTHLFGYNFWHTRTNFEPGLGKVPSVLWHCWLGGRKGIWPVTNWLVGCWHGYLPAARCRLAYGPADATATLCLLLQ